VVSRSIAHYSPFTTEHMNELTTIRKNGWAAVIQRTRGDKTIWAVVVVLALLSLLAVYSSTGTLAYKLSKSTESYLFKQIVFIIIGLMIIYFLHKINYNLYSQIARILYLLSVPLLIYTLFFGVKLNEGSRWIRLPIIQMTIQTSDLARLALFMYISRLLSKKQEVIKDFRKGFLPIIIPVAITCVLIAPANLSTALLIGVTSLLILFIGRVRTKHLLLTVMVALVPIAILIATAVIHHRVNAPATATMKNESKWAGRIGTWINRIDNFIYAEKDVDDEKAYHVNQMKIAIANGQWVGLGPGNSTQRNFMPHPYSDSIYATIIEEYGLLGGAFLVFIYLIFLFRCIRIFKRCPYAFGAFLALALSFTLVIQAIANMGVNVNLFPVTGVTLPLVSMGGSSFIFTCVSIGIILSVASNVEQLEGKQQPISDNNN
jgi:cell division protein FtsW